MKNNGSIKERFVGLLSKKPIKKQMYRVYFTAMVLPILFVGVFLIGNTSKQLKGYHSDLINSENLRIKNILFQITTQVHNLSDKLSFDNELQGIMTEKHSTIERYRQAVNKLTVLDDYQSTYMEIQGIEIYCDNPYVKDYKHFYQVSGEVEKSEWYKRAIKQVDVFWTTLPRTDSNGYVYWNLCLVRKLPLFGSKYNAVLVMRISEDYIRSAIDAGNFVNFVSVNGAPVFYSQDRSRQGYSQPFEIDESVSSYRFEGKVSYEGTPCFASISTFGAYQSDSKIYIATINPTGYSEIGHILSTFVIIIVAAILLPGILVSIFTNYITERIGTLRIDMNRASRRDYDIEKIIPGEDEISEASRDLHVMVRNIKEQEAQVYEARIKEQQLEAQQREMEYKRLASQINPHFLYNTLETIRMKAFVAGDKDVAGAIKLLGKSMRYVLNNTGDALTTLAKEIEHVKVYIEIQKMRFNNRFDAKIEVSDEVEAEKITILPLILQPIVENAVIHGIEELDSDGFININIYEGDNSDLCIDVIDNGYGMENETLEELRRVIKVKDTSRSASIGLYNINQRLIMMYGEEYGLYVDSVPGQGTRVSLRLPEDRLYQ